MSASTKKIPEFFPKPNLADADLLVGWGIAEAKNIIITFAEFKADVLTSVSADTEILFNNSGILDGDARLTYNPTTSVLSLQGDFNINGNNIINTGILTLPVSTDTLVGRATTDTLTNKSIDANAIGNVITNIGDAEIESHTSTKISITAKGQLNSAIVYNDQANTFGAFPQIFPSTQLQLNNPANTFRYIFTGSPISANIDVTVPLLTAPDIFVMEGFAQTLTNKTFGSTSNVWRTSGTSTLTALTTISRNTNNLDLDELLITDTLITSSVNLRIEGTTQSTLFLKDTNNTRTQVGYRAAIRFIDSGDNDAAIVGISSGSDNLFTINNLASGGGEGVALQMVSVTKLLVEASLITASVDLNIIDTTDAGFATSKVLTRNSGGGVNTIAASGGGTTNFLRADGTWTVPAGSGIGGSITDNQVAVGATVANDIEGGADFVYSNGSLVIADDQTGNVGYSVINNSTSTGTASLAIVGVGASSGDPFLRIGITTVRNYAIGVDNSDSDILKITTDSVASITPSTGTTLFSITSFGLVTIHEGNLVISTHDIVTDTATGTKFGTSATQKLGWWDAAPIVQPAHIVDPTGGGTVDAEARTAINAINALLASTGLSAAA